MNCKFFCLLAVSLLLFSLAAAASPENIAPAGNESLSAEPFRITLFIPTSGMIHSDQVLDLVNAPGGGVLFGTSFGLSLFNGTWSTRHINRDNISQGLMDEYITAVEYDHDGNLWIGYSGGIQIYNGIYYLTLRDQQLFKDPRIEDLQRWHDDMWVATGHSGIHRYRAGTWTWFQPMTKTGPGFYEIRAMTLDPASDSLLIATEDNGLWMVRSPGDPVVFEQIATRDGSYSSQEQVRRDPLGGVYFFNETTVIHYTPEAGFTPVLTVQDLTPVQISLNDLAAASDGKIYLATDTGIFIWKENAVYRHVGRFEGIGTSEVVRTVSIDAQNRVWFSTEGFVGYYAEQSESANPLQIITPASVQPSPTPVGLPTASPTIPDSPAVQESGTGSAQDAGLAPILNPILRAIQSILSRFGISI